MAQTAVAVAVAAETAMEAAPKTGTRRGRDPAPRRKRDIFLDLPLPQMTGVKAVAEMGNGVVRGAQVSLPDSNFFKTWQTQLFPAGRVILSRPSGP